MHGDPGDVYRARLAERRLTHERLTRLDRQFSYARLGVFALGVLVLVLAWRQVMSLWLILLPVAAFIVIVRRHERVIRQRNEAARSIAFYERGLARIEDRWSGTGERGERFRDDSHLYANDLDLFGQGSLFELLSVARTRAGEAKLAGWLMTSAPPVEIAARQEAVAELAPLLDLREMLSLAGTDVAAGVHGDELVAWAETPPILRPLWARWIAVGLTASVIVTAAVWLSGGGEWLLQIALAIQVGFVWPLQRRVDRALHRAEAAARDLDILGHLLERLEQQQFATPRLRSLRQAIDTGSSRASSAIRSLHRLVELHDWQHNLIFLILSLPFLWGTHLAWAIESWRARHGRHIRFWLDAVAEIEALSSLSAFRFEHPRDPFPSIVSEDTSALFEGTDLGHPLIPAARGVRNDVRMDENHRLLVVSGSNMSGKSTLAPHRGDQRGACPGWCPRAGRFASPLAAACGRDVAHSGFTAGRAIAVLRGDHPRPRACGRRKRIDTSALPAGRAFSRHELARSTRRCVRRLAQPVESRRHRSGHNSRPGLDLDRTSTRAACDQRSLRGLVRRWRDSFRLPHEAGAGDEKQCDRAHARRWTGRPGSTLIPEAGPDP